MMGSRLNVCATSTSTLPLPLALPIPLSTPESGQQQPWTKERASATSISPRNLTCASIRSLALHTICTSSDLQEFRQLGSQVGWEVCPLDRPGHQRDAPSIGRLCSREDRMMEGVGVHGEEGVGSRRLREDLKTPLRG